MGLGVDGTGPHGIGQSAGRAQEADRVTRGRCVEDDQVLATRAFYLNRGYIPVEEFPLLWSPSNPVLLLIKAIDQCTADSR